MQKNETLLYLDPKKKSMIFMSINQGIVKQKTSLFKSFIKLFTANDKTIISFDMKRFDNMK